MILEIFILISWFAINFIIAFVNNPSLEITIYKVLFFRIPKSLAMAVGFMLLQFVWGVVIIGMLYMLNSFIFICSGFDVISTFN